MSNPHAINIYTDGSWKNWDGGSGFCVIYPDGQEYLSMLDGKSKTTINRAELRACIEALKFIQKDERSREYTAIYFYVDSDYVAKNYKKAMWGKWNEIEWVNKDESEVANKSLWQEFVRELKKTKKRIDVVKVKAHKGNPGNEQADKLAKKSRVGIKKQDYGNIMGPIRRWLPIEENSKKIETLSLAQIFIQRIKPKTTLFDAHVQILRPRKYLGCKTVVIGILGKHNFHPGHIHLVRLTKKESGTIFVKEILKDIGKPSENTNLLK